MDKGASIISPENITEKSEALDEGIEEAAKLRLVAIEVRLHHKKDRP